MGAAAAQAVAEAEVVDNAYVISPVEVDVTHAIMSHARSLEIQVWSIV